ncbi:hypothetical protein GR160_07785 [Flavobacterium sp. Sd200]|uniref:hypothetical protein n=1 Tax=Flavobacterium sp. Sd200 TaxID=2692211 RepID=UPI00136833C7|nr:hypothetical protein [Flavobacterium sp. Sd200]MXN91129.1 hypothetical protein [Flavobacterium sp. Sd200]
MNSIKYLLIAFIMHIACSAQDMPNIAPPSPEASQVFKFTEVPVSLYTGVPNISIPLFEIESGGVTVPISISYHARGIKVAEIASRVGLGWTLNCGGMISRQVRDEPDEYPNDVIDYDNIFWDQQKRTEEALNAQEFGGPVDEIPDQYYFNANGISGKFIRDYTDGQPVVQQFSNIKVGLGSVGDDKGNSYIFNASLDEGDIEYSYEGRELIEIGTNVVMNGGAEIPVVSSAWHLGKIKTQKGPEINFTYEREILRFWRRSYDKFVPGASPSGYRSYVKRVESNQDRHKRIDFDKGSVLFEYEPREDINGGGCLKKIILRDINEVVIKQVEFTHEYVVANDDAQIHPFLRGIDTWAKKRMYLKTVQVKDASGNALPPHQFVYNTTPLPNRHSNSQDIWGYYNGKDNGFCLKDPGETNIVGGRSIDTIMSRAGMLEKIIYPDGGHTAFHYEHNKVFNHLPKDIFFVNTNPYGTEYARISNIDYNNPNIYTSGAGLGHGLYTQEFVISEAMVGTPSYMVSIGDTRGCSYPSNTPQCKFNIGIRGNGHFYPLNQTASTTQRRNIILEPGTYTLEVAPTRYHDPTNDANLISHPSNPDILYDPNDPTNEPDTFIVDIKWLESVVDSNDPIYAGGKRIKKIEYWDSEDHLGKTMTYDYNDPSTGRSSGELFGLANFRSIAEVTTTIAGQEWITFEPYGNVPGAPFVTYQEQSLGYGTVTEYIGEGSNTLGKTVHTFTMTPDSGLYYKFPYHPPTDNEWLRGKPLTVTAYKSNPNGSFSMIKKTENEYTDVSLFRSIYYKNLLEDGLEDCPAPGSGGMPIYCANTEYVKNRTLFRLPIIRFCAAPAPNAHTLMYKVYHQVGGAMDLLRSTSTDYLDNGGEFVTTTDYTYDYENHYNVAEQKSTTSDGTATTKYFYPTNPEMSTKPHAGDLVAKNIMAPLVTQSFRDGIKLSEQETVYRKWNDTLLAPEFIKSAKGTADSENRIQYVKIDHTNGNVLEVKKESGVHVSYLWGYNGKYPIAMIENAEFDSVLAALGTTEEAVKQMFIAPLNIRTLLPDAMVTTYGYKQLVGVTNVTDPKNYSLYYTYDSFGRLQFVKEKDPDDNFRTLSETEYHYREE